MNTLIPFGKYKGQPVEVLSNDPEYVEWLRQQDWFKSKYQQINNVVINNFCEPSETPEHNELVSYFTDELFRIAFVLSKYNISKEGVNDIDIDNSTTSVQFETSNGCDVVIRYNITRISGEYGLISGRCVGDYRKSRPDLYIECKPNISDDFPAIIRQCRNQSTNTVLYKSMSSQTVSNEQIKIMFGDIKLISFDTVNKYKRLLELR